MQRINLNNTSPKFAAQKLKQTNTPKEILISLHKIYINPFDRREIRELAMALDGIIDYMEAIPQSAKIYGSSIITPEMLALDTRNGGTWPNFIARF